MVSAWPLEAPLRLRNEIELAHYSELGSGYGGYSQDQEFFGYRQSI